MLKIKFLILLSSIFVFISCGMRLENNTSHNSSKFSVDYLSGGQNAFIFKNILTQQLIANNLFDANSQIAISITMKENIRYLATSVTKVASRKLNEVLVEIRTYDKEKQNCVYLQNDYDAGQSFLLAESSAILSNDAAQNDIFLINSENISIRIIDDLLSQEHKTCNNIE